MKVLLWYNQCRKSDADIVDMGHEQNIFFAHNFLSDSQEPQKGYRRTRVTGSPGLFLLYGGLYVLYFVLLIGLSEACPSHTHSLIRFSLLCCPLGQHRS